MNRLVTSSFLCLLSGCTLTLAEVRQTPPSHAGEFPMAAADLSYCVKRAIEESDSHFVPQLGRAPDKREFFVIGTHVAHALSLRQVVGFELRFVAHDRSTTVELREGTAHDSWLTTHIWPLIAWCSPQLTTPAADGDPATPPAAPTPSNPIVP